MYYPPIGALYFFDFHIKSANKSDEDTLYSYQREVNQKHSLLMLMRK